MAQEKAPPTQTVMTVQVPAPTPGALARQETDGAMMTRSGGDLAGEALAAQATAQVNAMFLMALKKPRDLMESRRRILVDCRRPGFAKKAIYRKPVGAEENIEGPSIRLAEAFARALGNIRSTACAIYDDPAKRIVRVASIDLETNFSCEKDVTVQKVIERRKALPGRKVLGQRQNSRGFIVFLLEATDDEIGDRENNLVSKAMRGNLLRLVPGDLLEEAMTECYATMENEGAEDPAAMLKAMADDFARVGVTPANLAEYLGHPLEVTQPKERVRLHGIYAAIEAGETTWAEVLAAAGKKPDDVGDAKGAPTGLADLVSQEKAKESKK